MKKYARKKTFQKITNPKRDTKKAKMSKKQGVYLFLTLVDVTCICTPSLLNLSSLIKSLKLHPMSGVSGDSKSSFENFRARLSVDSFRFFSFPFLRFFSWFSTFCEFAEVPFELGRYAGSTFFCRFVELRALFVEFSAFLPREG